VKRISKGESEERNEEESGKRREKRKVEEERTRRRPKWRYSMEEEWQRGPAMATTALSLKAQMTPSRYLNEGNELSEDEDPPAKRKRGRGGGGGKERGGD